MNEVKQAVIEDTMNNTLTFEACCETSIQISRDFATRYFTLTDRYEALTADLVATASLVRAIYLLIAMLIIGTIAPPVYEWWQKKKDSNTQQKPIIFKSGTLAKDRARAVIKSDNASRLFDVDAYIEDFTTDFKHMRPLGTVNRGVIDITKEEMRENYQC